MGKKVLGYILALIVTTLVGFAILTIAGLGEVRTCIICSFSVAIVGTFLPPLFIRLFSPRPEK
ncbi:MAG: hypothetical protein K2M12_00580 [Muribaculaceae bacterium]|nr:hypothetical protein [Muribaculaceae bacterium]